MSKARSEVDWNDDRIGKLRGYKKAHHTNDEIASIMGLTRGQISGASRRFCTDINIERGRGLTATNWGSYEGAHELADNITLHWKDRGYTVKCSVKTADGAVDERGRRIYRVETDMINGLPRELAMRGAA